MVPVTVNVGTETPTTVTNDFWEGLPGGSTRHGWRSRTCDGTKGVMGFTKGPRLSSDVRSFHKPTVVRPAPTGIEGRSFSLWAFSTVNRSSTPS